MLSEGRLRPVRKVAAYRWHWLREVDAMALPEELGGYAYRAAGELWQAVLGTGGYWELTGDYVAF